MDYRDNPLPSAQNAPAAEYARIQTAVDNPSGSSFRFAARRLNKFADQSPFKTTCDIPDSPHPWELPPAINAAAVNLSLTENLLLLGANRLLFTPVATPRTEKRYFGKPCK
jgi:hypothetical protein